MLDSMGQQTYVCVQYDVHTESSLSRTEVMERTAKIIFDFVRCILSTQGPVPSKERHGLQTGYYEKGRRCVM